MLFATGKQHITPLAVCGCKASGIHVSLCAPANLLALRALPLRPIQRLDENEREFLRVALHNYTRCLCTGDGYDLRVVFRIVQLWLR